MLEARSKRERRTRRRVENSVKMGLRRKTYSRGKVEEFEQ